MKPLRFHILLALAGGPLHGAEIRRRVEKESGGSVVLYPAMLYGALDEFLAEGLIQEVQPDGATPEKVRWRFYRLTHSGQRALEAETARLTKVLGLARTALETVRGG